MNDMNKIINEADDSLLVKMAMGSFRRTIDSRIETECIGCPPDKHPDDWFCAWKFTIVE